MLEREEVKPNEQLELQLKLLFEAAQKNNGRMLGSQEVRGIAAYIINLQTANQYATMAVDAVDNLLTAYVNEYGEELLTELLSQEVVVDGEIEEEAIRRDNENDGLDAPQEEEE